MRIAVRIIINAIALWVAASLIEGITLSSQLSSVLIVAVVFGVTNGVLGPLVKLLSFPFIFFTLGLFTFVVNAAMLSLTDYLSDGIDVDGFWNAVVGSVVISIVSGLLSFLLPDD